MSYARYSGFTKGILRAGALAVFLFTITIVARQSHAQPALIRGFVTDADDGQSIELANVVLIGSNNRIRGATTNTDGLYLIPRISPGKYNLEISFVGYRTYTDTLVFAPADALTLNVALQPAEGELDEILVETERSAGIARVTAGQQTIRPADIELIPTPDIAGDLASYLTTLPGVIVTGDRGGQLFIRGGEPTQNLVQLDGILLYQPFHVMGFYSAFPSDILSRSDIYAGGFGSKFGERISSVLDIAAREGNKQRLSGAVSASPFIATGRLEGPLVKNRVSILLSGRQSMVERGAERLVDAPMPFNFGDVFAKIHGIVTRNSRASITGLQTYDRGTLVEDREGVVPEEVRWINQAIGARYLVLPRLYPFMLDMRLSYSSLETELGLTDDPSRFSNIKNYQAVVDATFFGENTNVDAGIQVRSMTVESELGGLFQNIETRKANFEQGAVYAEPEFNLGNDILLRLGMRVQFFETRFHPFIEPRTRFVWESGVHQISAAAGLYHQAIVGLNDRRDAASVFTAWTQVPKSQSRINDIREGRVQRASHWLLGYRATLGDGLEFSAEGFYKRLSNLFIPEWTAFPRFTTNLQRASGRSRGFDARLELRKDLFYGYLNYGYSNTIYTALQPTLELWYGQENLDFRPPHDRRHQLNLLLSTSIKGFDLSARWDFGSGLPFSRALGFDGFTLVDDIVDISKEPGFRRVIYERPFNGVLPTYHRLDFSIDRTFMMKQVALTLQVSAINVYDRTNLFYLDVFTLRRVNQLPFIPSVGLKLEWQ